MKILKRIAIVCSAIKVFLTLGGFFFLLWFYSTEGGINLNYFLAFSPYYILYLAIISIDLILLCKQKGLVYSSIVSVLGLSQILLLLLFRLKPFLFVISVVTIMMPPISNVVLILNAKKIEYINKNERKIL